MERQIRINAGNVSVLGELNTTKTADTIWNALPIGATASTWGDEIYFSTPVKIGLEDGKETVSLGELGYWPPGNAFCVFFGSTPASRGDEIRPASAVTVFGRLTGDPKVFKAVKDGDRVMIEKIQQNR